MINNKYKIQLPGNGWSILGPGGGGAMYIPTISPFDHDTAIVACDMTGSYITHDGGGHWKELNFKGWAGAFAFDPIRSGVIYAGATGLYRSEDNGESWKLVFPDPDRVTREVFEGDHADHSYITDDGWPGGKVKAIAIDPERTGRILAGLNTGNLQADGINTGEILVYYSEDRGASWKQLLKVNCGISDTSFVKIFIDPFSPVDDREFYIFTDIAAYKSSIKGVRQEIAMPAGIAADGPERRGTPKKGPITDVTWGVGRTPGMQVFYLLSQAQDGDGRFRTLVHGSVDGCREWKLVMTGLDTDMSDGQARRFTRIAACRGDASVLYLSCSEPTHDNPNRSTSPFYFGIFKSLDGGESWDWALRIGDSNPDNRVLGWVETDYGTDWGGAPFNLGVSPVNPDVCYASDWGTAYRTIDGGKCWEESYCDIMSDGTFSSRGLDVTNVNGIHFDLFDRAHIAISCTDIGAFDSTNSGSSWRHSKSGVPDRWVNSCYWLVFDPDVKGRAWSAWSDCHDLPRLKMSIGGKVDNCVGGVCKTEDGMSTWRKSNAGIPENCAVTHILLDPGSPAGARTLYATGFGKGVFKSTDDGNTWTLKNNGIAGNLNAWKFVMLPDGTLFLLVARGVDSGRSVGGGLYVSEDGAGTWNAVRLPEGVSFPNDLSFDPENPKRLYLACWPEHTAEGERSGGLYVSDDGGVNWTQAYHDASHVYGIAVDPEKTSTVYISNFEGSVLRSDDGGKKWARLEGFDFKWPKAPVIDPYNNGMLYVTTFGSSVWYGPAK